ncbi:D-alanyl-D-alanine carboxypeptidase/D-alanyl-D-alanine-endopeptidase [Pontibacter sp. G13]|uniref:D-alanyl-D-alanine carboxypeptidase/D-alanyl-D-alanine endopeptidase n=1 Tax=Pontibacter sp. G13 TaxID=3074898 RepID=UPI002888FB6F|nr:D-alanyl-D-alanine carboxypeptidase/D-alanyl-D-alanine-endopeptidase [Pontibacter sp. G13]WNJ21468.1 D-alanyl-D-alanine carboxypeptidase/D-alanyl-D-alanine-endopeptidase [Pontibacter sp. G13]
MNKLALFGLLMLSYSGIEAQAPDWPTLDQAVRNLDNDPAMKSATWSLAVKDAQSGQVLYDHNRSKSLTTASTMKAMTTATALSVLGKDYRYETYLEYHGELENGVLLGDVVIRGTGDPSLGSERFGEIHGLDPLMAMWAEKFQEAGIKKVSGRVIGDDSYFSTQLTPGEWTWEDMGNYYGAGASGLNVHENMYYLILKPGSRVGSDAAILRTNPPQPNLEWSNELKTGASNSGDNAWIYGSHYSSVRHLRGTIPAGRSSFTIKGAISDPAWYCAYRFREELIKCGIEVTGGPSTARRLNVAGERISGATHLVYTHYSPRLEEIVFHTNQKSINVFAEALGKTIAVKSGKKGDTVHGMEAVEDYWLGKGIQTKGLYFRDGAGLSPTNAVSTDFMTEVLCKMYRSDQYEAFKQSLPVAGRSGSLKSMLRGTLAEGKLFAKSGYINGVRAYTGYVQTQNGKIVAFALISNHYACTAGQMRRKLEPVMAAIASYR